jgi:outer membrane protein assembly factor BamB
VLVGDHLYGDSDDKGIPFCAELMTGKIVWKNRGSGKNSASVVAADGHIYVRYADGTLALVKADPAEYKEVAAFKIPGSGDRPSWSHATILAGRLYLREGARLLCYDIRAGR